jgi:hypothetical protein
MKRHATNTIWMALIALVLTVCGGSSIDRAFDKLDKAIEKAEKNKTKMTQDDWKDFFEELEAPCRVLNEAMEKNELGALKKLKLLTTCSKLIVLTGDMAVNNAEFQKLLFSGKNKTTPE